MQVEIGKKLRGTGISNPFTSPYTVSQKAVTPEKEAFS